MPELDLQLRNPCNGQGQHVKVGGHIEDTRDNDDDVRIGAHTIGKRVGGAAENNSRNGDYEYGKVKEALEDDSEVDETSEELVHFEDPEVEQQYGKLERENHNRVKDRDGTQLLGRECECYRPTLRQLESIHRKLTRITGGVNEMARMSHRCRP